MKIFESLQRLFAPPKAQELKDEDFVIVYEQQPILDKVKELFQNKIVEVVVYTSQELSSCGQTNSSGKIKPFTNFDSESPHTYQSNLMKGEGDGTYHIRLASAVIQAGLGQEPGQDPFQSLQTQLKPGHPKRNRALQVAAILKQIGDELSPLPNDPSINMILSAVGGIANFDPLQKGTIRFSDLQVDVADEVEIQDLQGGVIASLKGERTIVVHSPDQEGAVTCVIERTYHPENLIINKGESI